MQVDWFALNLALPAIARDFDVPSTDLQWVVSGHMLSIGALMVTAGRHADIFGRRRVIVIGLVVFGLRSAVCGAALDETWLIAARVVQGVGAALIFPVAIAVVSSTFSGARQSRAFGVVLGFAAIGTALGPFVGASSHCGRTRRSSRSAGSGSVGPLPTSPPRRSFRPPSRGRRRGSR